MNLDVAPVTVAADRDVEVVAERVANLRVEAER